MKPQFLIIGLVLSSTLFAQKQISIEDLYLRGTFNQRSVSALNWMKGGGFYTALNENKIVKYNISTGNEVETILDGGSLSTPVNIQNYYFSADEKKLLLMTSRESIYRRSFKADYYVYDISTKQLSKLSQGDKQSYATFSPDGTKVAFVRDNNLFYVDLSNMREVQVTDDGKWNHIINGSTDWVYEEEFSFAQAFFWSPDSKRIAYYRFDESGVREFNMQTWNKGALYPEDYKFKYPKAGEDNSKVEIFTFELSTARKIKMNVGSEDDIYIPRVMWTKNPQILSIRKLNRLQNKLEIFHADVATGNSTVVLTETNKAFVDIDYCDDLTYLDDGKHFIHSSEQDGYKHLYLYSIDGKLIRQITSGNFEVTQFLGLDEKAKTLYYISTEVSPQERHFYSIGLDGKKKVKLSKTNGMHSINISPDFQFYMDYHSNATQPLNVSLYRTKGNALIKVMENNERLKNTAAEYGLAPKEFFSFKTVDGSLLDGYMMKPSDFDAGRQYPVLVFQYSGPGSQNVNDSWGGGVNFYWHQMLTQRGYIVAVIDTRGTGYRGEQFKKMTYKELGKYELEDHLEGARFLASLDYVDGSRLGIWGWSYGGYMSSLAMTKGAGVYKLGIAVAPVTNWRYYDTIYTERYMQTPQLNASGYDDNSPTTYANKLEGHYFLIHGTGDDNVHFQNAVALQDALIDAGKQFKSFYYPDKNHGIPGARVRVHLYTMMTDFILENL